MKQCTKQCRKYSTRCTLHCSLQSSCVRALSAVLARSWELVWPSPGHRVTWSWSSAVLVYLHWSTGQGLQHCSRLVCHKEAVVGSQGDVKEKLSHYHWPKEQLKWRDLKNQLSIECLYIPKIKIYFWPWNCKRIKDFFFPNNLKSFKFFFSTLKIRPGIK